jgi:hypothetical protein
LHRRGTRVDKIGEVAEEVLEASRADDLNGFAISRSKPDGYRILVLTGMYMRGHERSHGKRVG